MFCFDSVLLAIRSTIASIGISIIAFGALRSTYFFISSLVYKQAVDVNRIRLELGYTIILGLEFMVGADIIESVARPTYYDVGLLAFLVIIRTFLSYFLSRELIGLTPEQKKGIQSGAVKGD